MKGNRDSSLTPNCKTIACFLAMFLSVSLALSPSAWVCWSLFTSLCFSIHSPDASASLTSPLMKPERASLTHFELPRHFTLWGRFLYLFFASLWARWWEKYTCFFFFCLSPESCPIDKCLSWVSIVTVSVKILYKLKDHVIIWYFVVFTLGSLSCLLTPSLFLLECSGRPGEKLKMILPTDLAQKLDELRYVKGPIT